MRTYRLSRRNEAAAEQTLPPKSFSLSQPKHRGTHMNTAELIKIVDRIALGLMNAMVLVGLPLVAFGMVAQSL